MKSGQIKWEFSRKMESFIHKWSEAGDKWLKERLGELSLKEAEEDFDVSEKPKEVEPIKGKKKVRKKVKK